MSTATATATPPLEGDIRTIATLLTTLLGYRPGPPPGLAPSAHAIDAETAQESVCDRCGHEGLDYRPFHRPACPPIPASYKALAVCCRCANATEY